MKRRITDFFSKSGSSASKDSDSSAACNSPEVTAADQNPKADVSDPPKVKKPCVFQSSWLKEWPWLDRNEKGEMLCKFCINSNMKTPFTTGCSNFRTSTLSRHAECKEHKQAVIVNSQSQNLEKAAMNVLTKQEAAVTSAIDTVYWLAKEILPLKSMVPSLNF